MKIGIFGGAFDPVHRGHTALAESFCSDFSPDLLILVPTANPPHRERCAIASKEDRVQMLKCAFADFDNVRISCIEFERQGKSYTYDTLCALGAQLKEEFPNERIQLFLLVGSDEFLNFHKWYKYKELLSAATVYTAERSAAEKQKMHSYGETYLKGGRYILSDSPAVPVSSSDVRENIRLRQDLSAFLDDKVYKYIESKELYGV